MKITGRLPEGGLVTATAELVEHCGRRPYFSVTTDNGAAHELILRAIPELEPIVALHLSDENGWPMHAVADAAYHAKQEDPESLARHLRIPVPYARGLIDEMRWYVRDAIAVEKARVAELRDAWRAETSQLQKKRPRNYPETENWIKEARSTLRSFFRLRPDDNYIDGVVPQSIGYLTRAQRELLEWALTPQPLRWKTLEDLLQQYLEISRGISSIDERLVATEQRIAELRTTEYQQQFWNETIKACFSACWKRQADEAIELLKTAGSRSRTLDPGPVDGPQVIVDGEAGNPVDVDPEGYLPRIDLGGRCYYLAADKEAAGDAVVQYYRDMQKHAPEELAYLLGEETIRNWALGQPAKIGGHQIDNFDAWVDLAAGHPEELWASYDGREQKLKINEALAEEIGFEFYPDESDPQWMTVLAYQQ